MYWTQIWLPYGNRAYKIIVKVFKLEIELDIYWLTCTVIVIHIYARNKYVYMCKLCMNIFHINMY